MTIAFREAIFLRRYKRFLADVQLETGEVITVHCPNTGAMTNCLVPNSPCWISESSNPRRKYRFTWEIATAPGQHKAGVNTARANALVEQGITGGLITQLQGYHSLLREVRYGEDGSRIDFKLQGHPERPDVDCFVEVKSVTYGLEDGRGLFPDAVSVRATRHLRELISIVAEGHRAVLVFCVQHSGIEWVEPADQVDPLYGETLRAAMAAGVEVLAYRASLSPQRIVLEREIPVRGASSPQVR